MAPSMGMLFYVNLFLWVIAVLNDGLYVASRVVEPGGHPPRTDFSFMLLANCTVIIRILFVGAKYALFSDSAFEKLFKRDVTARGVLNSLLALTWGRLDRTLTFLYLKSAEEAMGVDLDKMPVVVCEDAEDDAAADHEWDEGQALVRWDNKFHAVYPAPRCSLPRAPHPQLALAFSADLDFRTNEARAEASLPHSLAADRATGSRANLGVSLPPLAQLDGPAWEDDPQKPSPLRPLNQITAFDVAFQLLLHPVIKDPTTVILEG